ncbi:MAG: cobalt transporter CbiM [Anaeromicrobium sp.]|uniref:cobalt transporter CbiM n=1 Tax=Anaeromicrobium sp. TaxID=1929132 RepID=UPI0025D29062|nr:cobalt transporter CbiM [Anaeromicrobium sp.]MCT4595112.1 cobalt transporter CbiM [Anaeromicrobium sp.]
MHIPDNYLSPSTCAAFGVTMLPIWKWASTKVKREITRQKMPLLGICTAFVFLIMMFNIPLPGGTTGHAVGATLAAVLLGPYSAVISVTIALAIQALFFGDGGILALGVNCFNMAFVMPFVASYIFRFIKYNFLSEKGEYVGAFLAGYISLNVAALLTALEFGIQPILFTNNGGMPLYAPYGLNVAIPAMMIPHLLVAGILEGLVTAGVYAYVKKLSPEIIYEGTSNKIKPLYGLIVSLVILSPLGLLATGTAWGEWAPEELREFIGFIPNGMVDGLNFSAPIPDYYMSGISEIVAYIFSGLLGVGVIFILIKILSKVQFKNNPEKVN